VTRDAARRLAECAAVAVVVLLVTSCTTHERAIATHSTQPTGSAGASTPPLAGTLAPVPSSSAPLASASVASATPSASPISGVADALPGMPVVDDVTNVYSHDGPGMLSPVVAHMRNLVYVPNSVSDTVDGIDPSTGAVINHFRVPAQPQHVVPSYDLKTLWVNSDVGNALTPIDPMTGLPGKPVKVADPYNLYFTPDGRFAIVMAERMRQIDWLDPHTMAQVDMTLVPCTGVNHADFSLNGRYFIVSCEFDGRVLKVDTLTHKVVAEMQLAPGAMPQDVKMAPDGKVFYVADMQSNGVWEVDGDTFTKIGFLPTGKGAHGLYVSRDASVMYVTDRGEGSISLIDLATRTVKAKWKIPGGGSPDMGGLSADGTQLWVSGRYNGVVYDISTVDGHLIRKVIVGSGPHGLCLYPQPGRYSLGHTGVFR
jgi:YVTN family beta-propeller protein